jgi:hypothetical protein
VDGFLFQFAKRGGFRLLAVADGPGGEFEHSGLEVVAVLADEDEVPVGGNVDDYDAGRGVGAVSVARPAELPGGGQRNYRV